MGRRSTLQASQSIFRASQCTDCQVCASSSLVRLSNCVGMRMSTSLTRAQGPGPRGQGSGVRGQGSGVRGQGSGVRAVQLRRLHETHHDRAAPACQLAARKHPGLASPGPGPHGMLDAVVVDAHLAVQQMVGERCPAAEAGIARLAVARPSGGRPRPSPSDACRCAHSGREPWCLPACRSSGVIHAGLRATCRSPRGNPVSENHQGQQAYPPAQQAGYKTAALPPESSHSEFL